VRILWRHLLIPTLIASSAVNAQAVVRIPDAETCPRCEFRRERLATLAIPESLPSAGGPNQVVLDARGRYWVLADDRVPLVFAADGRFLSTVGRQGAGPGEFKTATHAFAVPGDSVVVIDQTNVRAQLVGPDLRLGRAVSFQWRPLYRPIIRRWPDSVIMTATVGTPEGAGWPLHVISLAGESGLVLKSFGPGSGDFIPELNPFVRLQPLSASRGGGAWSIRLLSYTVYQWTGALRLGTTFVRRPAWFPGEVKLGIGHPDEPPPPHMVDVMEDSTGLLWVASRVESDRWKSAWGFGARRSSQGYALKDVDILKLWRTVIEVIDPKARAVVRRIVVNDYVVGFLPGGRVATYEEGSDGEPRYQIQRWAFVRP
jgi:hypothetical protein